MWKGLQAKLSLLFSLKEVKQKLTSLTTSFVSWVFFKPQRPDSWVVFFNLRTSCQEKLSLSAEVVHTIFINTFKITCPHNWDIMWRKNPNTIILYTSALTFWVYIDCHKGKENEEGRERIQAGEKNQNKYLYWGHTERKSTWWEHFIPHF